MLPRIPLHAYEAAAAEPSSLGPRPWRSASEAIGGQLLLGAASLSSLPVLAHNLGPERYGAFSLFLALLGAVSCQDFVRPLLVRERAATEAGGRAHDLAVLARASAAVLGLVAAVVALVFLDRAAALPFTLAVVLHALASLDYAELAARDRIARATAIRNGAWAAALVAVAVLSLIEGAAVAYAWPFFGANLVVWLSYRHSVGRGARRSDDSSWSSDLSSALARHGHALRDLLAFNLAVAVILCADRVLLEHFASATEVGTYLGCLDLALKLTVLGSLVGTLLYPQLTKQLKNEGIDRAGVRFVDLSRWILLGAFVVMLGLILSSRAVVGFVLGPAFEGGHALFAWALVGVFVHMLGFLITPWQRARGDFGSQRRAYGLSAVLVVAVGVLAIPTYGAWGALAAYLSGHAAELLLLLGEQRRLPRGVLGRRSLAALFAMIAVLLVSASLRGTGDMP